jgi:hypothetical protein
VRRTNERRKLKRKKRRTNRCPVLPRPHCPGARLQCVENRPADAEHVAQLDRHRGTLGGTRNGGSAQPTRTSACARSSKRVRSSLAPLAPEPRQHVDSSVARLWAPGITPRGGLTGFVPAVVVSGLHGRSFGLWHHSQLGPSASWRERQQTDRSPKPVRTVLSIAIPRLHAPNCGSLQTFARVVNVR